MRVLDSVESRRQWRDARTFDDLCALGRRFVVGEITFFPGWGGRTLDEESDAIRGQLERLCRAGFLTLASQPGLAPHPAHDGSRREMRAFVAAFVTREVAARLAQARQDTPIAIAVHVDRESSHIDEPVATRGGVPYLFAGANAFDAEIDCFEDHVSRAALAALSRSAFVSAYDPIWGRNDTLWNELARLVASGNDE